MQLWTLASGSSGNCFLLESEGTHLLVECGRPIGDIRRYLAHCRVDPRALDGILLTHAHSDHIKSAREVSDAYGVPIFASLGTLGHPTLRDCDRAHAITAEDRFRVGEVEVLPFAVPHDCVEPLGFRFESATARACVTTDLGWVPESVQQHLSGLDLLVLEANYDPQLLHEGPYPAFLKSRVAGNRGHLSNAEAGLAVARTGDRAPREVWLGHMSEQNNSHGHALETIGRTLKRRGLGHVRLRVTHHRKPSLYWSSTPREEQLSLF
ncbi:MAG: MBL fold metallo-hydrolase [Chloroflexi bacterium]|nr:MBL fold metallo-hydrolase [Chloroflexota bacterium]